MTDDKRLSDALAKLAEPVTSDAAAPRELRAMPPNDMIGAIFGEIDETVLARKLTFQNQSGGILELEVANRRLICLASLWSDQSKPLVDDLTGQVLSETRLDLLQPLHDAIKAFLGEDKLLLITATAPSSDFGPAEPGLTTDALRKFWSKGTSNSNSVIESFAIACQEIATAEIRMHLNEVSLKRGEEGDVEQLIEIAAVDQSDVQERLDTCLIAPVTEARLIVSSGPAENDAIISAVSGDHRVFLMLPSENRLDCIAIWQSLISPG